MSRRHRFYDYDVYLNNRLREMDCRLIKGQKGEIGPQGPAGGIASKGDKGERGQKGDKGDQGNDGAQGNDGPKGEPGTNGINGTKGQKGEPGTGSGTNLSNWRFVVNPTLSSGEFNVNGGLADVSFNNVNSLKINVVDKFGNDMTNWLNLADKGDTLKLEDSTDPSRYYYYNIESNIESNDASANTFVMDLSGIAGNDISMNSSVDYIFDFDRVGSDQSPVNNEVEFYLFNQPDAPTNMNATFQNSGGTQYIEISFDKPASAKLAGTIYQNSSTVFYTGTNSNENWLPAMNSICLDASSSALSNPGWNTLIDESTTPAGDARISNIKLYNTGAIQGVTGNYPNRIFSYVNNSNIVFGNTYDFRLAYKNNSVVDASNTVQYATVSASFGAFGPSNPPLSIQFTSSDYNNLTLSGGGSNTIDASLNFPWSSAPPPTVGYGANWSAQKNNSSAPNGFKQVGGNTVSYSNQLFTYTDSTTQNWGPNVGSLAGKIHPEYYYEIETFGANSSYYQEITSGSFGPKYAPNTVIAQKLVPIPARTAANYGSTDYLSVLGSSSGTLMNSVSKNTSGGQTSLAVSTRSRSSYTQYSVDFLDSLATITYFYNASSVYKYLANFGDREAAPTWGISPVTLGSYIGSDTNNTPITNFETQIRVGATTAYTIQDVSTVPQYGWVGNSNDGPRSITTAPFNLSTSAVKDIDLTSDPNLEGYYLGVDVSNIKLDVSLNQFEDVSNNSYNNYRWRVVQNLKRDGLSDEISFLYYDFRIGLLRTQDINISPLNITTTNPTLPSSANYFGLTRPELTSSSGNRPTVNISYTLNNINPDWAPPSSQNTLATFNFYIDPTNIVNDTLLETTTKTWTSDLNNNNTSFSFIESYPITYNSSNAGDYNSVPYSRALGTNPQFGSKTNGNIYSNNVTRSPSTNTYWSAANNADISFNSLPLWWDFVWNNTNDLRSTRLSYSSNPTGALLNITGSNIDCSLNNAGTGISPSVGGGGSSDPWVAYDHSNTLPNNQLMISSGQIMSGNNSNISTSLNPYIDYSTAYFGTLPNYQSKNTSGDTLSWSYGANIFYSSTLTPTTSGTIKWFVIYVNNPNTLNSSDNSKLEIKDGATTLTLGVDYVLFYMERDYLGSLSYRVNTNNLQSYTPWLDCSNKSFQPSNLRDFTTAQGLTPAGTGNGAYQAGNPTFPIPKIGPATNRVLQYYRIGLFNGGNKKITKITITYG